MRISKFLLSLFVLSVLLISCDDDDEPNVPKGDYEDGILISGEGSGAVSDGSISYVSEDFLTVEHQIYSNVNAGEELGTYLQSIAFDDDNAYICVDGLNSITVVDRYTFEKKGVISTGLNTPRYMTIEDGFGYVTNWAEGVYGADVDDDYIAVVDLATYKVISTLPVSIGVERIIENNGKLYVSHKGGNSTNNIISVIDIVTNEISEIIVNDIPDELFIDDSDRLVVLCEGKGAWTGDETSASIVKINTSTNTIESNLVFPDGSHPSLLETEDDVMYYNLGSKIYKLGESDTALPTVEFIDTEASYLYGFGVNDDNLFALDANFAGLSSMEIFNLNTQLKVATVAAPVSASKIYFN